MAPAADAGALYRGLRRYAAEARNRDFKIISPIVKKSQDTQQKVRDTQPNPRYSAKNNVAMHMIATFMPNRGYQLTNYLDLYV